MTLHPGYRVPRAEIFLRDPWRPLRLGENPNPRLKSPDPRTPVIPWAHPPLAFILCGLLVPGVSAVIPRMLLLVCVLVLAGCGQKGPLYMPDESQDESTEETDD